MIDKLEEVERKFERLTADLSNPDIISDTAKLQRVSKERAGLDVITDGEMRRESYSNRFATAIRGVDIDNPGSTIGRAGAAIIGWRSDQCSRWTIWPPSASSTRSTQALRSLARAIRQVRPASWSTW